MRDVAAWRRIVARGVVRCRRDLSWWWRRRQPPLRRVSGDVVTADFFLGLVRACPGQPVKFSGRYAISGPILIDFEILSFWA
ncbi:hypothetical protein F511_45294 [Dorcoceras hygrometricum]|uniref:Uncharacterized protein n=1 Tax=Dorcoceras hygrometricum TaxID=472368 RepID=A0A2Z7A431_9LAMI|nr:hypothetical protein F511_45294 [Dorcoceras hygrometricum]